MQEHDILWPIWVMACVASMMLAQLAEATLPWLSPLWILMSFLAVSPIVLWRMVRRW